MKALLIRICVVGMIALLAVGAAGCGPQNPQGDSLTQNDPTLSTTVAATTDVRAESDDVQVELDEQVSGATEPIESQEAMPQQDGSALLQIHCGHCHRVTMLDQMQKERADWERILSRMERTGVRLTDPERSALLEYLASSDKR